jgi:hypothetical protein
VPIRFKVEPSAASADAPRTEVPDTVQAAERPVLEVSGLTTRFEIRSGLFSAVKSNAVVHAVENVSFACSAARRWRWWANPAAARPPPAARVLRLVEPLSGFHAAAIRMSMCCKLEGQALLRLPPQAHADDLPGPVLLAQPAHEHRGGDIVSEPLVIHKIGDERSGSSA